MRHSRCSMRGDVPVVQLDQGCRRRRPGVPTRGFRPPGSPRLPLSRARTSFGGFHAAGYPVSAPITDAWRNRIVGSGEEAPDQLLANPGELADPPEGPAGRPRRRARPGRLGPAGPGQPAHRLRRRRPRPRRGGAHPRRADRARAVRRPRRTRRRSSSRRSTRSGRWRGGTRRSSGRSWRTSAVDDAGLLALLGDLGGTDPKAGLTDPDEVPEPPEEPYVKPGELYARLRKTDPVGDARAAGRDLDDPRLLGRRRLGSQVNSVRRTPTISRKTPNMRCATTGSSDVPIRAPKKAPTRRPTAITTAAWRSTWPAR